MPSFSVEKDPEHELPVPTEWRGVFTAIVERFRQGDYALTDPPPHVAPIANDDAAWIAESIKAYGATLSSLPEKSWDTSIYSWQDGYWIVLVDLFTIEEELSDLVLHARVTDRGAAYFIEVISVHVP